MNCNFKTMIKFAGGLGLALAIGYFVLPPQAQAFVLASAPLLLALVCPVTMVAMMFTMRNKNDGRADESETRGAAGMHPEGRDAGHNNS
jgi:hypothetical protein